MSHYSPNMTESTRKTLKEQIDLLHEYEECNHALDCTFLQIHAQMIVDLAQLLHERQRRECTI